MLVLIPFMFACLHATGSNIYFVKQPEPSELETWTISKILTKFLSDSLSKKKELTTNNARFVQDWIIKLITYAQTVNARLALHAWECG